MRKTRPGEMNDSLKITNRTTCGGDIIIRVWATSQVSPPGYAVLKGVIVPMFPSQNSELMRGIPDCNPLTRGIKILLLRNFLLPRFFFTDNYLQMTQMMKINLQEPFFV